MVPFQAPGAPAKYRLGNEAETYGEFIFVNNWVNPDRVPGSAWFKTEVMIEGQHIELRHLCQLPKRHRQRSVQAP